MKKSLFIVAVLMFLIVILGAVPTLNSVSLTTTNPLTNDTNQNLTGSVDATMDGKNMSYVYNWYKNGALNATTLIFDGLENYYPLDNDTYDYFGSNNGTASGASLNSSGKIGNSYYFDGAGDYINLSSSIPALEGNNVTINAWIYPTLTSGVHPIVTQYDTGDNGYYFYIGSNNLRFWFDGDEIVSSGSLSSNQWYHAVATYDGSTRKLYLNGVEVATGSVSASGISFPAYIGHGETYSGNFSGLIDEVQIYNRSLSASEVDQLYHGSLYGGNVMDSSRTAGGENWTLGVKAGDYSGFSGEDNSSVVEVFNSNVTGCQVLDVPGMTYVLQNNVSSGSGSCFNISAENITFDLNSYSINAVGANNAIEIYLGANFTITNGNIYGATNGVWCSSKSDDGNISSLNIFNTERGINIANYCDRTIIENNYVKNSSVYGIIVSWGPDDTVIQNNRVEDFGISGVGSYLAGPSLILNNNATGGDDKSVQVSSSDTSTEIIYNNSFAEIVWTSGTISSPVDHEIGRTIFLENNLVAYYPGGSDGFNSTANVTLRDTGITGDITILKDGVDCGSDCVILETSGDTYKFNVTSWSNYSIQGTMQEITDCQTLDVAGATYSLQNNITGIVGTCFDITTDNITLDGNGYILAGDLLGTDYGINTNGSSNSIIRNFAEISGFYAGVWVIGGINNTLTTLNLESNSKGLYLESTSNNLVTSITTGDNGEGTVLYSNSNNNNLDNITSLNDFYGFLIYSSSDNVLTDIEANNCSILGMNIVFSSDNNFLINFNSYANTNEELNYDGVGLENSLSYNNTHGQIEFIDDLDFDIEGNLRFGSGQNIEIISNNAFVNSSSDISELNVSANVTLRDTGITGDITILKDGVDCGSDCVILETSGDTYKFNVTSWSAYSLSGCGDGVANNGETCSTCSADVGACSTGGDTGSSTGGSSGGGGGDDNAISKLLVDSEGLNFNIVVGKTKEFTVNIINDATYPRNVILSDSNLGDFVDFEENIVYFEAGETKEISLFFTANDVPGLYTGKVLFGGNPLPVSMNIRSKEMVIDGSITVPEEYKEISSREGLETQISLIPLGDDGQEVELTLKYFIKDFEGKTYITESETRTISSNTDFKKILDVSDLKKENYLVAMEVSYEEGIITSSSHFSVVVGRGDYFKQIIVLVILVAVILGLLVLWKSSLITNKKRRH